MKKMTEKIHNNLVKFKQIYKIDIIFINSENSRTSHQHRLLLNLTGKINFRRGERNVALSNLRKI